MDPLRHYNYIRTKELPEELKGKDFKDRYGRFIRKENLESLQQILDYFKGKAKVELRLLTTHADLSVYKKPSKMWVSRKYPGKLTQVHTVSDARAKTLKLGDVVASAKPDAFIVLDTHNYLPGRYDKSVNFFEINFLVGLVERDVESVIGRIEAQFAPKKVIKSPYIE